MTDTAARPRPREDRGLSRPPGPDPRDPWERWGWLMGAIWLVFLGFPIVGTVRADAAMGWQVASLAAIGAFAAVYVTGFVRFDQCDGETELHRYTWRRLAVLAAIAAVPAPVIGTEALAFMPFLVAFAMYGLSLPSGAWVSAAVLAFTIAVPVLRGDLEQYWFFTAIVALTAVSNGLVRLLGDRQEKHRVLERHLDLVSERERVARDVHDVLGHSLTVITVKSELAQRLVDDDPARAKAELDDIRRLTRTALAEVRATVAGLRVARLDEELAAAEMALRGAGIAADLPQDHEVADPRHRILLAWVLREAVTNVVRHSGARRCIVRLDSSSLSVSDDGSGTGDAPEGNGLRGLRERVDAAGGRLDVGPGRPGAGERGVGTRVEVTL